MKKVLSVLITVAMLLTLCACGAPKAEDTVKTFSEAMKAYDFEKMQGCLVPSAESIAAEVGDIENEDEVTQQFFTKMKDWASKMTYEVVSVKEEGDHATAEVKYYYVDSSPIMEEFVADYFAQGLALALQNASEEEISALAEQMLTEKMETVETGSAEMSITYDLVKTDREWKITEVPDDVVHVLTANFLKSFEEIAAAFSGEG